MSELVEMQLAIAGMKGRISHEGSLTERLEESMRYVQKHSGELFWMSIPSDDFLFRTALATVMTECSESDKDLISRSIQPLKMLSAASSGVPVDWSALDNSDDLLPLLKLWHESKSLASS